jgi:hypothetical protein
MLLTTRQAILSLLLRTAPAGYTRPADLNTLKVSLYTTMPADDGTGGVEATGSSYAAQSISALDANFAISGDEVTNVAEIQFPLLTGSLLEVVGFVVKDNANVLRWAQPAGAIPQAFTFNGSTDTFSRTSHGLPDGAMVRAFAVDSLALPGGISANTTYYVRDTASGTLNVSATVGGAAVDLTTDGACYLRRWYGKTYSVDDRPVIPAGALKFKLSA